MNKFTYIIVNIIETLLRGFPIACKTGIVKIGNPDENSPVFLTCNYHLTVERVKKALKEMDCYLLVANSNGINVWCGSAGGHLTNHDVISILKTSGVEQLVSHRKVVLPQLAATGIEARVIKKKTGWDVLWGPVYAKDIPEFVENNYKKTQKMRVVEFPLVQRIEMATMWAFPFSVILASITFLFLRSLLFPLTGLVLLLPFIIFGFFPFYSKWLHPKKKGISFSEYTIFFDFGRIPLLLWGIFLFGLIIYGLLLNIFTWAFILQWGFISFALVFIISLDLMGSTPIYKSGLHEDRFLKVILDENKCKGAGFCEKVCPRNCYEVDKKQHRATMPMAEQCVQCGACIVQCPFDALYFKTPKGDIITPKSIRTFKLNLIGKRSIKTKAK